MSESGTVRVIPSGKIYKQMFDAQVQLSRTLSKSKDEPKGDLRLIERQNTLPLVRVAKDELGHGVLTGRQKTWVDGFPNDPYVENPVLYRQYAEFINTSMVEAPSSVEGKEVRGLPDVVVPAKTGSDIIERIAEGKKQRHEAAVEDMQQYLSVVSAETEPLISETSSMLRQQLADDDAKIAKILSKIESNDDLITYLLEDLEKIWTEVQSHTAGRQRAIQNLDETLVEAENCRMNKIREIFQDYSKMLENIAHLMVPDLDRFMDREAQIINQTMLSNRRSYSDLFVRLMSSDIEREKAQYSYWKRRVEDWKKLHIDLAVKQFSEHMAGEDIVSPPEAAGVLEDLLGEQTTVNEKRLELIKHIGDLKPPSSTKTAVYQWNKSLQNLTQEIESLNQCYLVKLHNEYEKVCQQCLEVIENVKQGLIDTGACNPNKAQQVVDLKMLPIVGERQRVFENNLETMEKSLEEECKATMKDLKTLFKYAQGAAHVWDVHEIGLAKQERALQEKLETCRHEHDNQNQEKEANLDMIMDRMRQDASEDGLKNSLNKSLDMLEKIREAYHIFHSEQTDIVKQYPEMVSQELLSYDNTVCKFFTVDRNKPKEKKLRKSGSKGSFKIKEKSDVGSGSGQDLNKELSLTMVVSDILSTAKGTTFYVLTVAGEYGAPPESEQSGGAPAFFTEVSEAEVTQPEYIKSITIPKSIIVEVKETIRMNFLNHLEEWTEQSTQRASSVVVAKTEELNSELDLRLHLHKPRARRAEMDVHNVRAAELVMHAERVSRHCKGVHQAVTELRQRFNTMTQDHNQLAVKFRKDIESLEYVFINATKSSKLLKLQNQLSVELEKFMSHIRTSLRQFRRYLDENLQMLRESNARFIKSFKLFSDGGNFCPEEIEEYRKKLEKMSQKIDSAEGSIMSDLEGMESKRLDQATKVAVEFEDRFKSHMLDLVFMEKIARWLTNTQVKIKGEVANSNSQAQVLAQHLNDIDRRIDACEHPNLDKEQISSEELNAMLPRLFENFRDRSTYLNCSLDLTPKPSSATLQGNPALGARVGFISDVAQTPISKAGKQPMEDPSVGVIKAILNTQKSKMRFGIEADLDADIPLAPSQVATVEARDKMKSSMSNHTSSDKSKQTSRKGTAMGYTSEPSKQVVSALRRSSKSTKYDRKYMVFGDKEEDKPEFHFLGVLRSTLAEALDGLLSTAELYYRQKGGRAVTRPQALQETFEQCADTIIQKLQSYFYQAEEYHNQCLQEFRCQLNQLEHCTTHIPPLLIKDLFNLEVKQATLAKSKLDKDFAEVLKKLEIRQEEHKHLLRPSLGHPHMEGELKTLCDKEQDRHQDYIKAVEEETKTLQESTVDHAKKFIEHLARTSENQLLQFDNLLVIDDVQRGRVQQKKYPTSELIRRKNAGLPLEDDDDKQTLPRGKHTWPGIPNNELVLVKPEKVKFTASVTTAKTTLGHSTAVKVREQAYLDYKSQFENSLKLIEDERQKLLVAEQRWVDNWNTSVQKIRELY